VKVIHPILLIPFPCEGKGKKKKKGALPPSLKTYPLALRERGKGEWILALGPRTEGSA